MRPTLIVAALAVTPAAFPPRAAPASPPQPEAIGRTEGEADAPAESRLHATLGADYVTGYYFRGYQYEDTGLIVQPYADFALDVWRGESATVSLTFGVWNSFHGQATDAGTDDGFRKYWYEVDLYGGVALETGPWTLGANYYFYESPSDAWETIEEIEFTAAFDDSERWGGPWSLQPSATLVIETGANAGDGGENGTYLELGVAPGFTFEGGLLEDASLSFPIAVGLSLSDYYEGEEGEDDTFGFFGVGALLEVPLGLDESWGSWTLSAGVQAMVLGDVTEAANDGDDTAVVATVGLAVEF